jgi:hypothetical protein
MTVQNFTGEQIGEEILLSMEVVSGENVWPGAKAVAADADLKVEADILAAEIVEANTVVEVVAEVVKTPVDVSKIVVEVKTLKEANAAKPKPVVEKEVIHEVVEEVKEEVVEVAVEQPVIE